MASRTEDYQPPSQEQVKKLVQYRDLLFPGGEAIDPVERHDHGNVIYKHEVNKFYELVGDEWLDRNYNMSRGSELCCKPEKLRTASWVDIRAVLSFCSRQDRNSCRFYSVFHLQAAGIRQALLRAKELAQI